MKSNRVLRQRLAAFVLAFALVAGAASTGRAEKVVSHDEAMQGWISLFDGETLFGWNQLGDAQWKVVDGKIVCESGSGGWLATTSQFADFELVAKIHVKGGTASGFATRAGLEYHPSENGSVVVRVDEPTKGDTLFHEVKISANGDAVTASIDGKNVDGLKAGRSKGYVGILFQGTNFSSKTPCMVEVSEVKLRPLNLTPIFNGKDLSEWNILPGHKSEFAVVDGAINIKHGNGQIESKKTFKDFVAQLDIYSNGDHLNSGVFYRGPVGIFWKGYESQVRNQWMGEDRAKPVDFGTGGNYGNEPARKVVSSDREWFKKTLIVDGNHASIWINGYLASDFTDVRPPSPENDGKTGYVAGPGTIHLQGHDPTTDLSFKNIQVHEY